MLLTLLLALTGDPQPVDVPKIADIFAFSVAPRGNLCALLGSDCLLRIVDLDTSKCIRVIESGTGKWSRPIFSPDGDLVVLQRWEWKLGADGLCVGFTTSWHGFDLASDRSWSIADNGTGSNERRSQFSPNGKRIMLLHAGESITVARSADGLVEHTLAAVHEPFRSAAWVGDDCILTGGRRGSVDLWRLSDKELIASHRGPCIRVDCAVVAPDRSAVFVGGTSGSGPVGLILTLPELRPESSFGSLTVETNIKADGFFDARWTPDSKHIVMTTGTWHSIEVHDRAGRRVWMYDYQGGDHAPLVLATDPLGQFGACARYWGGQGRVFEFSTGKLCFDVPEWLARSDSIQWNADGSWLIAQNGQGLTLMRSPSFEPSHRIVLTSTGVKRAPPPK